MRLSTWMYSSNVCPSEGDCINVWKAVKSTRPLGWTFISYQSSWAFIIYLCEDSIANMAEGRYAANSKPQEVSYVVNSKP